MKALVNDGGYRPLDLNMGSISVWLLFLLKEEDEGLFTSK